MVSTKSTATKEYFIHQYQPLTPEQEVTGKSPEHNKAKHTKHPHSLEWHNGTIHQYQPR